MYSASSWSDPICQPIRGMLNCFSWIGNYNVWNHLKVISPTIILKILLKTYNYETIKHFFSIYRQAFREGLTAYLKKYQFSNTVTGNYDNYNVNFFHCSRIGQLVDHLTTQDLNLSVIFFLIHLKYFYFTFIRISFHNVEKL